MTDVTARGLTVAYDGVPVVDGVDLRAASGEWLGLIGPNGSGKTTVLRALAGTIVGAGEVRVGGDDPTALGHRARSRRVARVPQQPTVPSGMTVLDYVLLGRTPYIPYLGTESAADLDVVRRLLERLDLAELGSRELSSLSGGEFQRAVLARALAQEAPVLLLDEPTSALDIGHAQQVLELVDDLRVEHGLTVVSAMHDLTLAAQSCDRLVLLAHGRAVAAGRPEDVLTGPALTEHYGARVTVLRGPNGEVVVAPVVHPDRATRRHGSGLSS